jgi:3-hydroxyacyl-[acyl-carrier-protein] dehydratase
MGKLKSAVIEAATGPVAEKEPGVFVKSYSFAPDFAGFSGHFPGYAILPAFVQLLAVLITAEEANGCSLTVLSVEKAKFQMEIFPGREVEVECRYASAKGRPALKATLSTASGIAASMVLTFEEAG